MDKLTIAKLAWYMPRTSATADVCGGSAIATVDEVLAAQGQSIRHYAKCFSNLSFGWDFAKAVRYGEGARALFPAFLTGKDIYVWRAYNYLKGAPDKVVAGALALTLPSADNIRNQVDALLVAKDVDAGYVSKNLGLDKELVEAYEKLFFNVLDRKQDHAFIANVVYPEGRLVEAFEDYLDKVGMKELLLRAGFIYGPGHVLYAAGLAGNPFASYGANDGAQKLDAMFMTDGLLYATMGWMHQSAHARPIVNARLSMQAGKMGGTQETTDIGLLSLGNALRANLITSAHEKAQLGMDAYAGAIEV